MYVFNLFTVIIENKFVLQVIKFPGKHTCPPAYKLPLVIVNIRVLVHFRETIRK
jgi:hypothetical protein